MSKPNLTTSLPEIVERLAAFFSAEDVKSFPMTLKKDKSAALAAFYIDARAVQNRLDETCYWRNEFREDPRGTGKSILAGISVLVDLPGGTTDWVTRWDGADNTDIEATKGGLSGAMRRAAVTWGVGRYLYNVPGQWVDLKPGGRYFAKAPRIPAEFLPNATRAKKARQASVTPPDDSAPAPAKTKRALSADQVKQFSEWKKEIGTKAVTGYYQDVLKGVKDFSTVANEIELLIAAKPDK